MGKKLKPNSFFSVNKQENDFNHYAEIRIFYAFIHFSVILITNGVKCLKYSMDALLSNKVMYHNSFFMQINEKWHSVRNLQK